TTSYATRWRWHVRWTIKYTNKALMLSVSPLNIKMHFHFKNESAFLYLNFLILNVHACLEVYSLVLYILSYYLLILLYIEAISSFSLINHFTTYLDSTFYIWCYFVI